MKQIFVAVLAVVLATPAAAQVGHTPEGSPYRDVQFKHEFAAVSGWYAASRDRVGVAPQSGPLLGARYEIHVSGPLLLHGSFATVWSQRAILDPAKPPAQRITAVREQGLYLADAGLTLQLTGEKSWHRLVPLLTTGLGVASDFKGPDPSGFQFGTTFALSFGAGVRWIGRGPLSIRADVSDHLYQIEYPLSYSVGSGGATPANTGAARVWLHNASVSLGVSYLVFR